MADCDKIFNLCFSWNPIWKEDADNPNFGRVVSICNLVPTSMNLRLLTKTKNLLSIPDQKDVKKNHDQFNRPKIASENV